mgnify:CR=1 FL=1
MFVFPHHSYFGRSEISINVKLQKAAHFDQSHACLPDLLNFENAISTAASGFDCTFPMSKSRFCFGALLSRVFYCIVCFSSAIFVVILPILRVSTTLLYTISCTPPHLAHNLTFASALRTSLRLNLDQSICDLRRIIRKPFVSSLLGIGPINTLRNIVTVNAFIQYLLSSEAAYGRPCSGISLSCLTQHYLVSNQDDHPRQLRYCHAYTRSTRHCQTFHRTRHTITIHCSSLPQPFFTKW